MTVHQLWEQGINALPKVLKEEFGKPRMVLNADKSTGIIILRFRNKAVEYSVIKIPKLDYGMLSFLKTMQIAMRSNNQRKVLVLAPIVYPKIALELIEQDINFLDIAGNIYLNEGDIYVLRSGTKPKANKPEKSKSRLFSEAGLKMLFGVLNNPEFINLTYRDMAAAVNISAASISIIMSEMRQSNYLHEGQNKRKIINSKKELLSRWVQAYKEQLKPKILIGYYTSKSLELLRNFKKIDVTEINVQWSGEAAANLYTNYLSPGKLSLFVTGENKKWMSALKLIRSDAKGEIEVLKFFWDKNHPIFASNIKLPHAVPLILAYAELITSNDSRNIDTAQRIFDEYIQFTD
ncbi:MAG: type IV toxin-antitoxin system AbiEi family antitoxin [Bacteroidota bacterium]